MQNVWRNLYAGQEATVRTGHGTADWFKLEKEYVKTVFCHPAYSTYTQSTSCEMLGWMKLKLDGIKTVGRNGNNLTYADDTALMAMAESKK